MDSIPSPKGIPSFSDSICRSSKSTALQASLLSKSEISSYTEYAPSFAGTVFASAGTSAPGRGICCNTALAKGNRPCGTRAPAMENTLSTVKFLIIESMPLPMLIFISFATKSIAPAISFSPAGVFIKSPSLSCTDKYPSRKVISILLSALPSNQFFAPSPALPPASS